MSEQSVVERIDEHLSDALGSSESGDDEAARESVREARQMLKCLEQEPEACGS